MVVVIIVSIAVIVTVAVGTARCCDSRCSSRYLVGATVGGGKHRRNRPFPRRPP